MPPTITITEDFRGRNAGVSEDFQSTYTRVFKVDTDDCHVGPKAVKAALTLAIGQPYRIGTSGTDAWFEEDLGAVLKSVDLTCDSPDGRQWTVTAQYGPWTTKPREESPSTSPRRWRSAASSTNASAMPTSRGRPSPTRPATTSTRR
jgi:hypothetical protein